jgi:DNA-binding NarL/FixJ family response regulator
MRIKGFLADRVAVVRKIEKADLEKEPDIEVVGQAEDEFAAVKLIMSLQPRVVLTGFGEFSSASGRNLWLVYARFFFVRSQAWSHPRCTSPS